MENNDYVLLHDYGYGREKELTELIKLKLRNKEDLSVYVLDAIENAFINHSEIKINIKKV